MTDHAATIRQFWPLHTADLELGDVIADPQEGIVCPCGTILGWPQQDEHDYLAQQVPEDNGSMAGSYLDDLADSLEQEDGGGRSGPAMEDVFLPDGDPDDVLPEGHGAVAASAVKPVDPIRAALTVIDPTRPYTPDDIERQLIDIEARLEQGQHFQRVWEERAFTTKLKFTLANARAVDKIYQEESCPADVRRERAKLACEEELTNMMLAEMMVKGVRETMHNLRSQLSGYQTIQRSVAAGMSGGNSRP